MNVVPYVSHALRNVCLIGAPPAVVATFILGVVISPFALGQGLNFRSISGSSISNALLAAPGTGSNEFGPESSGATPAISDAERARLRRDPLGKLEKRQDASDLTSVHLDEIGAEGPRTTGAVAPAQILAAIAASEGSNPILDKLRARAANANGLRVVRSRHGTVSLMEARDLSDPLNAGKRSRERVKRFLHENRNIVGLSDPNSELELVSVTSDGRGQRRFRHRQMYEGIPVFGQEASVYVAADGAITSMRGAYRATPRLSDTTPVIDIAQVKQTISALHERAVDFHASQLVILPDDDGDEFTLAWHVEAYIGMAEGWHYFVDAKTGAVIKKFSAIPHGVAQASGTNLDGVVQSFTGWQSGSAYYMIDVSQPADHTLTANPVSNNNEPGDVWVYDCKGLSTACNVATSNAQSSGWNAATVSALTNVSQVISYYNRTYNRSGIDGQGSRIPVYVNYGASYGNAFWNPAKRAMYFGTGDGTNFRNLAAGLDVAAHEMTHGVINNTANLTYEGQSGALNESFADFFGAMVDRQNWTLGETVTVATPGFLRSMANPHQGQPECATSGIAQPSSMSEYFSLSSDNGGVHCDSGIPNRAAYLIAEGLSAEGLGSSIGKAKTEKIYYYALTQLMHPADQFLDARRALISAASTLYGATEAAAVGLAWDSVGVVEPQVMPTNSGARLMTDADVIAGVRYLLYVDPSGNIYVEGSAGRVGPVNLYSATQARPAVYFNPTLNDGFILYANAATGSMRAVRLSTGADVMAASGNYHAFAVSQDGSTLAWVNTTGDSNIYVMPKSGNIQTWPIRVETQDGGTQDVGAIPDTLSFDYRGENITFDFAIPIKDATGNVAYEWSIGNLNLFTGRMETLASAQPLGINLGNPVYATNNDYVIAFDAIDATSGNSAIVMYNANKNELKMVANPDLNSLARQTFGRPVFSDTDAAIWFQTRYTACSVSCIDYNPYYIYQVPITKINGSWSVNASPIQLSSWYGGGAPQVLKLGARTINASISTSSASLDFGNVSVNSQKTIELTISNTGNVDVDLADLAIVGVEFSQTGSIGLLPRNQSVVVPIAFTPTGGAGARTSTLTIRSDTAVGLTTINLSGTAAASVPGAPIIGTATAGNAQATVTFSAPGSNGGAAITGYTATSSPGGLSASAIASPITVTGLSNGTAYKFAVTATNSAGTGPASAESNSVTPIAPTTTTTGPTTTTTAVAPTTTTTASTTTTTLPNSSVALNFVSGWNLVGNGMSTGISVASMFADPTSVNTVWKWIASSAAWAFYAPSLSDGGAAYAASKGYSYLSTINGGDGFWVNAKGPFTVQLSGNPMSTSVFADSAAGNALPQGWSLIAIGDAKTPQQFVNLIAATPPAVGQVATTVTTLWAWDATLTNWFFYAPSLVNAGTQAAYIASKAYLDFGNKVLAPTTGFWVNKP